jgi:hypothetical protein
MKSEFALLQADEKFECFSAEIECIYEEQRALQKTDNDIINALQIACPSDIQCMLDDRQLKATFCSKSLSAAERDVVFTYIEQARKALASLRGLSDADLKAMSDKARIFLREGVKEARREHGKEYYQHHPLEGALADADLDRWISYPTWNLEEAVALSLGKDPEQVNSETLSDFPKGGIAPFPLRQDFEERLEFVRRALAAKDLTFPIKPQAFVEWCQTNRLETKFGMAVATASQEEYARILEENGRLKEELDAFNAQAAELNSKSRGSLYSLLLAIAVGSYGYQFERNSGATTKILDVVVKVGLTIDAKTIRELLKRAAEDPATKDNVKKLKAWQAKR